MKPVFILSAKRTPISSFQGMAKTLSATELGAKAIEAAVDQAAIHPQDIEEVLMGCVLTAGLGQAPARQAMIQAGLAKNIPAVTISKVCGSGMRSLMFAADAIKANSNQVILAGGMESMSNAPYLLNKARAGGYRLGHGQLIDHLFYDGLEDAYQAGSLMGTFAEQCAKTQGFSRQQQDAYAITSLNRTKQAQLTNVFDTEIIAITLKDGTVITQDEQPQNAKIEKIPLLKPAFAKDGTITAANASSISDGAAALILASEAYVNQHNLKPLAMIKGQVSFAREPAEFCLAPIGAIEKLLQQLSWNKEQVDLWEINEAFAVVTLAAIKTLDLDSTKVNIHGGACALGHPIGASGARIVVTLIHALKRYNLKRGIACLCIGGGEATAIAIEIPYTAGA